MEGLGKTTNDKVVRFPGRDSNSRVPVKKSLKRYRMRLFSHSFMFVAVHDT